MESFRLRLKCLCRLVTTKCSVENGGKGTSRVFSVWSTVWSSVNITNWHAYSELVYAYLMLRDFIFRQLISLGYLYLGKQQFYWIIIIEHHGQKQRSFFHCLLCGVLNVYMIHKMIKHIKRHISARIHFQL